MFSNFLSFEIGVLSGIPNIDVGMLSGIPGLNVGLHPGFRQSPPIYGRRFRRPELKCKVAFRHPELEHWKERFMAS
jgi:hypothetical protein